MKKHSEKNPDWEDQRMKIIGLGESSIRKSYYPELQERLHELEQTNAELLDAIEEIALLLIALLTFINNSFCSCKN